MSSPTVTPNPQPQSQSVDPQAYSDYLRAQIAAQANTTGLTQTAPNLQATPPVQRQRQQPGPQSNQTFGPGQGAARKREAQQNLVKSAEGLANQFGQYQEQKKMREYQQVTTRFTQAAAGVQQAQAQVQQGQQMLQQAAARLQQNPQDDAAKQMVQQGQQLVKSGQQALQQNQTILNDMANDPKQHKVITKGFGVDDKNADTPERQAAMKSLQQTMGVGQGAAGILSQVPQTQQLSPQAQAQSQARQAGVVGAPATQGQVMQAQAKLATTAQTEAGKDQRAQQAADIRREALGLDKEGQPLPLDKLPPAQQVKIQEARSMEEYHAAQTNFMQAKQAAMQDPNSVTNKIAVLRAQGSMLGAQARMMGAITGRMNYDMRALGTDEKGNPLPGTISVAGKTIGSSLAPNIEKVMGQKAAFTDIRGAMNNLEGSALAMKQSGSPINDPKLVAFTNAHDEGTFNAMMKSEIGQTLTSSQRDYVIAYHQAVENISALRSTLKGSTAQANIDRMIKTLPGPGTPNYDYANAQIKAIYGQLDRLGTGIPNLNLDSGQVNPAPSKAPAKANPKDPLGLF